eukprot:560768-Pleurochrysis_carterae.AAC.1
MEQKGGGVQVPTAGEMLHPQLSPNEHSDMAPGKPLPSMQSGQYGRMQSGQADGVQQPMHPGVNNHFSSGAQPPYGFPQMHPQMYPQMYPQVYSQMYGPQTFSYGPMSFPGFYPPMVPPHPGFFYPQAAVFPHSTQAHSQQQQALADTFKEKSSPIFAAIQARIAYEEKKRADLIHSQAVNEYFIAKLGPH